MESSRDSRRKGRGMEEIPLFCEEITGWWRPRAHAHVRDEEPSVRTWTMPAAGPGPKLTGADQGRRRGGATCQLCTGSARCTAWGQFA